MACQLAVRSVRQSVMLSAAEGVLGLALGTVTYRPSPHLPVLQSEGLPFPAASGSSMLSFTR